MNLIINLNQNAGNLIILQPISMEEITAAVVSVGVPICKRLSESIAPLNRKGTQTFNNFAPPRRLNEMTTLKIS